MNNVNKVINFAFEEEINGIEIAENSNGEVVVSSLQVAKNFDKEHKSVIRTIEDIKAQNCALIDTMFFETSYRAGTGKAYKCYYMNRDGFSLLVMGFTGKKALDWKLRYIEAFNLMEKKLRYAESPALQSLIEMKIRQQELEERQAILERQMAEIAGKPDKRDVDSEDVARKARILTSISQILKEFEEKEELERIRKHEEYLAFQKRRGVRRND